MTASAHQTKKQIGKQIKIQMMMIAFIITLGEIM